MMKMGMKKITHFSIAAVMVIMTAVGISYLGGPDANTDGKALPVSTGLDVIASGNGMAKAALAGEEIAFAPEDFERALNQKLVQYVTFTSLPDPACGELKLGSAAVSVGMSVSRENIHKLAYVPKTDAAAAFSFTTGNGYEIECALYSLDSVNYCPTSAEPDDYAASVTTHRNVSVYGRLVGSDFDGDALRYEIVSYPSHGTIYGFSPASGDYKYTPAKDYVGTDRFSYVVRDCFGNYSASCEVAVTVKNAGIRETLSDMGGRKAHSAAISMVENGIMSATHGETGLVFSPESEINREDFVAMAMMAAGVPATVQSTPGFADDGAISADKLSFISTAKAKGYLSELRLGDGNFDPKAPIYPSDAAIIVNAIIGGNRYASDRTSSVFADHNRIPKGASDAVETLCSIGVIGMNDGYFHPELPLTKENAALMLEAVMNIKKTN